MDDNEHRSLARMVLISVSAMLGASTLFVGTVMLLLSVLVERAIAPAAAPAADQNADVATSPRTALPRMPKGSATVDPSKAKTGDRS